MQPSTAHCDSQIVKCSTVLARRRPLVLFCILTFLFSWGYWGTLLVLGQRVGPGSNATHLPGLFAPFLSALITAALTEGRTGVRRLLVSCMRFPTPRLGWILLACSPVLLGIVLFSAAAITGQGLPSSAAFNTYPGTLSHWPLIAVVLLVLLVNGVGEEGGWRGYALPLLTQGRSKFSACLFLTAIWLFWHAPLFALNQSMAALLRPALLGWALGLAAGSFLLAWLYWKSQSVLVVALWHTAFNFVVATEPGRGMVAAVASTVVMVIGFAIAVLWWREPELSKE